MVEDKHMSVDSLLSRNVLSRNDPITQKIQEISTKMRQSKPHEMQYDSISEMDPSTLRDLNEAQHEIAKTEKFSIVAQNLINKSGAALVALDNIRQKAVQASAAIEGYNPSNMTPERLLSLRSTLRECLSTMATQLNSRYNNGYIFNKESVKPVDENIMTNIGNVAPDGTISSSFVYDQSKSADKIVDISDKTSANTTISASDPSFVDIAAGIWGILNTLNAAPANTYPNLPQVSLDKLKNGLTELTSFTIKVKDTYDLAKSAVAENSESQGDAKQKLSNMEINTLTAMKAIKELQHLTNILMALETTVLHDGAAMTRTIAAAAGV